MKLVNVYLINCTRISPMESVLIYAVDAPTTTYKYYMATLTREEGQWKPNSVIPICDSAFGLPECATRGDTLVQNNLIACVREAITIALDLEVLRK